MELPNRRDMRKDPTPSRLAFEQDRGKIVIGQLHLVRFKNFRDATLSLGNLTLLVGTNASGKSNLRDAFRFLHGMARGYLLSEIIGEKYVEGGALQWKGIRGGTREVVYRGEATFSLETTLNEEGPPSRHAIEVEVSPAGFKPRVVRESLWQGSKMVYDSHPADDPPVQEGGPYLFVRLPRDAKNRKHGKRLRFLDNQPVLTQLPHHPNANAKQKAQAEQVISGLESMRFLDLSPDAMRTPSVSGQVILGDRGENLSSVLQAICEQEDKKRAVLEWVRQLMPLDVSAFDFVPDQTGKVLVTLIESDGRRTSAYSASDGTLRFLALIAAMLGPDPARFYFFEELDNGIHPTRLYLLLQLIEQSVGPGRIQVVGTTHSPQLLAFLSTTALESAALVYRLSHHPEARIGRILDIPEARRILANRTLARLHESGWLENAVEFLEGQEADAGAAS
jgi:predicted ATPase